MMHFDPRFGLNGVGVHCGFPRELDCHIFPSSPTIALPEEIAWNIRKWHVRGRAHRHCCVLEDRTSQSCLEGTSLLMEGTWMFLPSLSAAGVVVT